MVDLKTDMVETLTEVRATLKEVRAELLALTERISVLESEQTLKAPAPVAVPVPAAAAPPIPEKAAEPIPEDILLVISAAVAAFLGERVPIRQIRLISHHGWATQGRVSIQASHYLTR